MSTKYSFLKVIHGDDSYWGDGFTQSVKCPECGFEYQHFGEPYVKKGNDNYEASWKGRGDLTIIPMEGECGSKWEMCFGFHKGQTGVFINLVQSCKEVACFIYFIEAVGLSRIKIGVSVNPEERLKQLSTGSPTELQLIGKIPGDVKKEKELQNKFKHLQYDKEWFHFTKELQDCVNNLNAEQSAGD